MALTVYIFQAFGTKAFNDLCKRIHRLSCMGIAGKASDQHLAGQMQWEGLGRVAVRIEVSRGSLLAPGPPDANP